MVEGQLVNLRLVEESDLPILYEKLSNPWNRGPYFPVTIHSQAELTREYQRGGFWTRTEGTFVITDKQDTLLGEIFFFRPHRLYDSLEIAYIIFDEQSRGRGYGSEALRLCRDFIFRTTPCQRLELNIGTENRPSVRAAEKAGFRREGILRSLWYSPELDQRLDGIRFSLLKAEWHHEPRGR